MPETTTINTEHQWPIAIRSNVHDEPRKITTIASLGGAGFSVSLPCHKAHAGYLFKQPVAPGIVVPHSATLKHSTDFGPRDKARLIYHLDGFVEFHSDGSDRISAKKDVLDGEVRGLGLYSLPLGRPTVSGPALAMTVYGIDQFDTPTKKEASRLTVFGPADCYYRKCAPDTANAWMLAIYPFPQNTVPPVRIKGKKSMVSVALEPLNPPITSVLDLEVIFLPEEKMFLGLCVYRVNMQNESKSGWLFSGPGDYKITGRGHVLMGMYPWTIELPLSGPRRL